MIRKRILEKKEIGWNSRNRRMGKEGRKKEEKLPKEEEEEVNGGK